MTRCRHLITFLLLLCSLIQAQPDSLHYNPQVDSLISQVSSDNLMQHIEKLADANGNNNRVSYTPGNEWAARYIKDFFDSVAGLTKVEFDTFRIFNAPAPYDTIPLVNVVATLQGSTGASQYYMVGGHFDATANLDPSYNWPIAWKTADAPGADDNATGIAAMLEIARILANPENSFKSGTTIKFVAFGAEERHPAYNNDNHWGSRFFAHRAFVRGDDILGAYILDMIGFNSTGNYHFDIVSNSESSYLGQFMLDVKQTYQIDISSNSYPFPEATYSDHEQFWQYNYPAILLIENAPPWEDNLPWYTENPYYHRRSDTPDKVNLTQVEKITKLSLGTIASLSTSATKIKEEKISIPESFSLLQNYPNPFNSTTTIRYRLQTKGKIELAIFNLRGQKITQLVNSEQQPGKFSVTWNAGKDLSSGLYIVVLKSAGKQVIRKIALIK